MVEKGKSFFSGRDKRMRWEPLMLKREGKIPYSRKPGRGREV